MSFFSFSYVTDYIYRIRTCDDGCARQKADNIIVSSPEYDRINPGRPFPCLSPFFLYENVRKNPLRFL